MEEFQEKLKINDFENKELKEVKKETKKIENRLVMIIYKKRNKFKKLEIGEYIKKIEKEGQKRSKKICNKKQRKNQQKNT